MNMLHIFFYAGFVFEFSFERWKNTSLVFLPNVNHTLLPTPFAQKRAGYFFPSCLTAYIFSRSELSEHFSTQSSKRVIFPKNRRMETITDWELGVKVAWQSTSERDEVRRYSNLGGGQNALNFVTNSSWEVIFHVPNRDLIAKSSLGGQKSFLATAEKKKDLLWQVPRDITVNTNLFTSSEHNWLVRIHRINYPLQGTL